MPASGDRLQAMRKEVMKKPDFINHFINTMIHLYTIIITYQKGKCTMNNKKILAVALVNETLNDAFFDDALAQAFGERWPRTLAHALKLFPAHEMSRVTDVLTVFDAAGMNKREITEALWTAARMRFDRVNARTHGAHGSQEEKARLVKGGGVLYDGAFYRQVQLEEALESESPTPEAVEAGVEICD